MILKNSFDFVVRWSANQEKRLDVNEGEYQGHSEGDWDEDLQDVTRCSTTGYAVTHYLCGRDAAEGISMVAGETVDSFQKEIDRLEHEIRHGRKLPELVYRLHVSQQKDTVGHVWVIHVHRNGTFDWYQSFIGQYSLGTWMKKEGAQRPFGFKKMRSRIEDLRIVLLAKHWDAQCDEAYENLFDVSIQQSKAYFEPLTDEALMSGSAISFLWEIVCDKDTGGWLGDEKAARSFLKKLNDLEDRQKKEERKDKKAQKEREKTRAKYVEKDDDEETEGGSIMEEDDEGVVDL
jgi:hypothetical protein